jgi:hypothetical protein
LSVLRWCLGSVPTGDERIDRRGRKSRHVPTLWRLTVVGGLPCGNSRHGEPANGMFKLWRVELSRTRTRGAFRQYSTPTSMTGNSYCPCQQHRRGVATPRCGYGTEVQSWRR